MTLQPTEGRVTFRRFVHDDLPQLARWLADSDVARWYDDGEPTAEHLGHRYRDMLAGTDPAIGFVITIDDRDAGYIQAYEIAAEADYARQLDLPDPYRDGAVGIDLYLGEPERRGVGWGPVVLRAFLRSHVFGSQGGFGPPDRSGGPPTGAPVAVIGPEPANHRAITAYERAGFRWFKTVHVVAEEPGDTGDEHLMGQTRADFESRFGSDS